MKDKSLSFFANPRLRSSLAGALGGFVAWLLIEPTIIPLSSGVKSLWSILPFDFLFGAIAGVTLGLALGAAEGLITGSKTRAWQGALWGAGVGFIGGGLGLVFGELIYQPLAGCLFVGRSLGWGVFGAALGLAQGFTRRSWKGARNATLGGVIGGLLGGVVFDLLLFVTKLMLDVAQQRGVISAGVFGFVAWASGAASRAAALTLIGASVGLWIVLLAKALADGSLKIISGRFEGLEFLLDKVTMTVGALGNADIAIPGDPQVMPSHAVIRRVNGQHQIESHSPLLLVNKRRVDRCSLATGDVLQVGNTSLLYRRRHLVPTASSEARTGMLLPAQTPPPAAAARPSGLRHLQTGERFMLYAITTIGRDGANQIVLTDPAVRARHLEIRYEQDRFILHDLGGGVLVNGRQITGPNMLKVGFRVRVGNVELEVV